MALVPMKPDFDFEEQNSRALESAAKDVQEFVRDHESLQAAIDDARHDQKDLFTVMKSKGYNVKALRDVLRRLRQDAGERAEHEEAVQLYMDLLRE